MRNDGDYGTGDCGERERAGVAARADYCDAAVSPLQCRSRCSNGATSKLSTAADFTLSQDPSRGLRAERRFCNGRRVDQPILILEFIQLNKYFETLTIKITLKP